MVNRLTDPTRRDIDANVARRLDYEKARRDRLPTGGGYKPKVARSAGRQLKLWEYVRKHELRCFSCNRDRLDVQEWAKTGRNKKGPWAICLDCVKKRTPAHTI